MTVSKEYRILRGFKTGYFILFELVTTIFLIAQTAHL